MTLRNLSHLRDSTKKGILIKYINTTNTTVYIHQVTIKYEYFDRRYM